MSKPSPVQLPPLGSHMSIAGGVSLAPGRAASVGCTALQVFVKNNNRWVGPATRPEEIKAFPEELKKAGISIKNVFAHTCYLINLGSPKPEVVEKSVAALKDELVRCGELGIPGLVLHPGAHLGTGREAGIAQIAELSQQIIDETPDVKTRILFETTAGQGTTIGHEFQDLSDIIKKVARASRVGVCLDTCHIFSAGYDIRTPDTYNATMKEFDRVVGLKKIKAFHLNDSKFDLGTRKDRHEHIGQGFIGEEAFRLLLTDPRFAKVPMCLETHKDDKTLEEDRMNLATLRRVCGVAESK